MKKLLPFLSILFVFQCSYAQEKTANYQALTKTIEQKRTFFSNAYSAADKTQKAQIIKQAQTYLLNVTVDSLFTYWYNTPWSFYGQSRIPGQGTIACGYFVTGILTDAGFNIPGSDWAKLASETFIVKLCPQVRRSHNAPVSEVLVDLKKREDGLYLVGLDYHVGFIYKRKGKIKFVHSSYYQPTIGVMQEELTARNPFSDSKYRVIGNVLDARTVEKWLTNYRIE